MKYEDALKVWGAKKLVEQNRGVKVEKIDVESVKVEFEFDEGYACCGGSDPNCYCSFAEPPTANVKIIGRKADVKRGGYLSAEIGIHEFDFATVLREICEAGEGNVSI